MSTPAVPTEMSTSPGRRPLRPVPVVALLVATTLLVQTLAPVSRASAQPRPAHRAPLSPLAGSTPALPPDLVKPDATAARRAVALVPAVAGLAPGAVRPNTGPVVRSAIRLSPAVRQLVVRDLGIPLPPADGLEGDVYTHYVTLTVPAPRGLPLGLPAGYPAPEFRGAALTVDRITGTLTFVANSSAGTPTDLSVIIPRAATNDLAGPTALSGTVNFPALPVLGGNVALSAKLAYTAGILSLTGSAYDPVATALGSDVVVAPDAHVTLSRAEGLRVSGTATLGKGKAALEVAVAGSMSGVTTWSLGLSPIAGGRPWEPVAGLSATPSFSGTLSQSMGSVRFDVTSAQTVAWSPLAETAQSVTSIEYSNGTPPAPAPPAAGPWIATTGTFAVSSGPAGTLVAAGQLVIDTARGHATFNASGPSPLTLASFPQPVALGNVSLHGDLSVGAAGLTGTLTGSAIATVNRASVRASVRVTPGGTVVASFPVDEGALALGPAATLGTAYWASSATSFADPASGRGINLAAGLSGRAAGSATVTTPKVADPTSDGGSSSTAGVDAAAANGTYTISSGVLTYLSQTLGIPLTSTTLTGKLVASKLTVAAGPPAHVVFPLPTGSQPLSFGPSTLSVDETTNVLTVTSKAAVAGGATAKLAVTIDNANTSAVIGTSDVAGKATITGLAVLGTTINLLGKLGAPGGAVTFVLKGTLAADTTLAPGVVIAQGASVTLSNTTGVAVAGSAIIGTGPTAFTVTVKGAIAGLSDWSIKVTDPNAPSWQPVPNLVVTPNFLGTINDAAGTITFDLKSANAVTWTPSATVRVVTTNLEVSDKTPPARVTCPGISAGSLWLDVQGTLTFSPGGTASPLTLSAEACVSPAGGLFSITTAATGDLTPPTGALFTLKSVSLNVTGDIPHKKFSVTASASLTITGSTAKLTVAVSFASNGSFVAAVGLSDLSFLHINGLSGHGAVWVSTKDIKGFDPSTRPGLPAAAPFHLRAGVNVTLTYAIDPTLRNELVGWGIPIPTTAQADASLSPSGFSVNVDLGFGAGDSGQVLVNAGGVIVYLNAVSFGITLGASPTVSLSGTATLHTPSVTGDGSSQPADVGITLFATFGIRDLNLSVGISITGVCGQSSCPWQNAFGVNGLTIDTFAATLGVDFETAIPTPTLSFSLDNVILPQVVSGPIGLQAGAAITIDINFDLEAPIVHLALDGAPPGSPALLPLTIASTDPGVRGQIVIDTAELFLAPVGGVLANQEQVSPGVTVKFDAVIASVLVHVYANVSLTTLSVDASISIGGFQVGTLTVAGTVLTLHIGTDGFSFSFAGGFSDAFTGISFQATINATAISTLANAGISLTVTGGLPSYLSVVGHLSGAISVDSSGVNFSASGYGSLIVAGQYLGSVSFSYALNTGTLWQSITATAQQVAQAFYAAYGWLDGQVTYALNQLRYTVNQVGYALQQVFSLSPEQIAADLAAYITSAADTIASTLQNLGISPDQIASSLRYAIGASDDAIASALQTIGYAFSQIGPALQTAFGEGQQAIANALQYIGASWWDLTNVLNGIFTANWDGSYYFSVTPRDQFGNSGAPLFMDVSGGSQAPGAQVIDYPWDGGANQRWWIQPTGNGYAEIVNVNSGQCLTVPGGDFNAGDSIQQWPCTGQAEEQWSMQITQQNLLGPTAYLVNGLNGYVVDAAGASWFSANLDQWYNNGGWNQQWTMSPGIL